MWWEDRGDRPRTQRWWKVTKVVQLLPERDVLTAQDGCAVRRVPSCDGQFDGQGYGARGGGLLLTSQAMWRSWSWPPGARAIRVLRPPTRTPSRRACQPPRVVARRDGELAGGAEMSLGERRVVHRQLGRRRPQPAGFQGEKGAAEMASPHVLAGDGPAYVLGPRPRRALRCRQPVSGSTSPDPAHTVRKGVTGSPASSSNESSARIGIDRDVAPAELPRSSAPYSTAGSRAKRPCVDCSKPVATGPLTTAEVTQAKGCGRNPKMSW